MKKTIIALGLATVMASCSSKNISSNANPLLTESKLDFGAPDFAAIRSEHFLPAFEEGMKQHLSEIKAIADNQEKPNFENTIVAMQKSGQLLNRTSEIFFGLAGAHATDSIRAIEEEIAPKLSAHSDSINLNTKLFNRIKTVYEHERAILQGEDARLLEEVYQGFVRNGANLNNQDKLQLTDINRRLTELENKFDNQIKDGVVASAVHILSADSLKGLSKENIAQAKADAQAAGKDGYLITLQNTTKHPYLAELDNREVRHKLFEASIKRNELGDQYDTQQTIKDIALLRAKKARLLGKENYASWTLQDQMAKEPQHVELFIRNLVKAYLPKAQEDTKELEAFAQTLEGNSFHLEAWDWDYYAEKLRKSKFDINENDLKPYFHLDSVVKNGIFYMAKQLYNIDFIERNDLPVYAEGVKIYDVLNQNKERIALFYTDYYRRATKGGGAWMSNWVSQSHLLGKRPIIYNVCNFAPPINREATLLNMDEVLTVFHEFGHALHGIFANQKYEKLSGTNVARDFVEMPSQFHEHWATDPAVIKNYAKHYKTGAPMPQELIDRLRKAATFNQAYALGENIAAVILDMAWHTLTPESNIEDVRKFEEDALAHFGMVNKLIPPRYKSTYFSHSMGGDYSAGYYSYLWSEVLDNNIYDWFKAHGGLTAKNGARFKELILSKGNSEDLNAIFKEMTGLNEPDVKSLMRAKGLQ